MTFNSPGNCEGLAMPLAVLHASCIVIIFEISISTLRYVGLKTWIKKERKLSDETHRAG